MKSNFMVIFPMQDTWAGLVIDLGGLARYIYFKQVPGLIVCRKICSDLNHVLTSL